ncbi:Transcriptional regulator AcuR [Paraglaciecola mesophila]|uniref:Transcriptional regulator AcuR n=1 Tax=Paraglaciecola mesophila TaxID=197222 RepID=A0A857JRW3_9ALTE|nr:TetR/AcrR family transcriptional regulator [Paraglaciecola mesophila]QHJ13950.1 Transcriptional regulator AcuR [Paraglaciecola mesophila]
MKIPITKPRRGRPPKVARDNPDTKAELIRVGLEHLTEFGFASSGIDTILKKAGVPKGSFYHYFASKEAYGEMLITQYDNYFSSKLDFHLRNEQYAPLMRVENFVNDAAHGMARHDFKRGCLVGNLGQEVDALPVSFRGQLAKVFANWQHKVATCLEEAKARHEIHSAADCHALAEYFWIGWEGAVSRAKLTQSDKPLRLFLQYFLLTLTH